MPRCHHCFKEVEEVTVLAQTMLGGHVISTYGVCAACLEALKNKTKKEKSDD